MNFDKTNTALIAASVVFLLAAGWCFYKFFPSTNQGMAAEAIEISSVVLIGLALVVLLMTVLVMVYSVLGLANPREALALPEGSIRALIAFSLVLVFVCMSSFLFNSMNMVDRGLGTKPLVKITEAQLTELKAQFVVAYEPARKADGSLETDLDGKSPLYNAAYFAKRSKDSDDFAKQIFTTLATVFVSVISFYFGSSATSAGAKAARDGGGDGKKSDGGGNTKRTDPQSALPESQGGGQEAQSVADSHRDAVAEAKPLAGAGAS